MKKEQSNTAELTTVKKDISATVLQKIALFQETGELRIPQDYSPENALKSAYLVLSETKNKDGKLALDHCSKESIANALLKMVVWGLSPLKKQCSFIMYADKLECVMQYPGSIALAKRYGGLKSIKANAIFEGDKFAFKVDPITGRKEITQHEQTLESIGSNNIKGAYAVYVNADDTIDVEIMNISQIRAAWDQGGSNGTSPAHRNFPDQMACKTVINRAVKLIIRGSSDQILYEGDQNTIDVVAEDVSAEVANMANKEEIDIESTQEAETVSVEATEAVAEKLEDQGPDF